jgi:hypothetical protein
LPGAQPPGAQDFSASLLDALGLAPLTGAAAGTSLASTVAAEAALAAAAGGGASDATVAAGAALVTAAGAALATGSALAESAVAGRDLSQADSASPARTAKAPSSASAD